MGPDVERGALRLDRLRPVASASTQHRRLAHGVSAHERADGCLPLTSAGGTHVAPFKGK